MDSYKKEQLEEAIKLLRENGYVVRNITKLMISDSEECEEMQNNGEDKECCECSCSVCIMQ
ncbi:hypothetical protein [uncultured Clostridium sp.]|uniref:hypothetical protein n=1 Tax=uncultured Clostridium sp. TaxID=59620 RepID=UPI0032168D96